MWALDVSNSRCRLTQLCEGNNEDLHRLSPVYSAGIVGRSRDRFLVVSLGIFSVVPPTEPCAPWSTQPLKVSTRDFSWGKGGRCIWLTTYHPCSAETSRKSGALTYPEPPWATSACRGRPLPLLHTLQEYE